MRRNYSLAKSLFSIFFILAISILLISASTAPAHAALSDFLYKWGEDYYFVSPAAIAKDSTGNIYVTNAGGVYVFSSTGLYLRKLGASGQSDGQFDHAQGIAFDGNGNVYVTDFGNHRVQVFSSEGAFIRKWGTYGSGDGQFIYPHGVAIDADGNVYVTDYGNHRVQVFSNEGVFIRKWGTFGYVGSGDGKLWGPRGIAVDLSRNVYVMDAGNRRVQVFDNAGTFLRKWGIYGSGDGQFLYPNGIAVDSNGNVYVADAGNNRVQVFSKTGIFITKWGSSGSGDGQFNSQYGLAVDGVGTVYVADTYNNRVQIFSNTGTFVRKWEAFDFGNGDGQFHIPHDITVDGFGNVYVVDAGNNRIQVFSNDGTYLRKWGTYGSGDGQFADVWGIAVDVYGNLYVADNGNNRIQVFSSNGTFLRKWGTNGSGDGQFRYPKGIAIDANRNVYVTDGNNNRIQVFNDAGIFIRKWTVNGPIGIAVASSTGDVYIADTYNNGVQVFSNTGSFKGKWGSWGANDGQFYLPHYLTVDLNGKVFVADSGNNRVQVFDGRLTDTQAPVTTYTVSGIPGNNKWYVSDVDISLTATDTDSGVNEIHYSINGTETVVAGSSASFTISADGEHSVSYYAVDNAGNTETAHPLSIKIDKAAPTVTASPNPAPNADGWNITNVTVSFTCNDAMSGIESCQAPIEVVSEGAGQVISGTARDFAGLMATASATVNIDKTVPVITASVGPAPNVYGWNNTDVTVTFTCSDTLSGIFFCPAPVTVTTEGAGQVITGTAVDIAGNTATASMTLNIDKTPPSIPSLSTNPGMLWPPNHKMVDVMISGSAADFGSDVASAVISVTDEYGVYNMTGLAFGSVIQLEAWREGTDRDGRQYTITAVVTDKAGNKSTASTAVLVPHDMR